MEHTDMEIKKVLNEKYDISVPYNISKGIDDTLKRIENKNNRKFMWKLPISIAASFMLTMIVIGTVFPTVANEIPILNKILGEDSIFNLTNWGNENEHFENLAEAKNYSIEVDQTKDNVCLKEIGIDGVAFYLIYEIQENEKEVWKYDSYIQIEGEKYQEQSLIPRKISNNKYRFTQVCPIGENIQDLKDSIVKVCFIKDEEKLVDFDIKLSEAVVNEPTKIIIDKKSKKDGFDGYIDCIYQSPIYVSLLSSYAPNKYDPDLYHITLQDQNGEYLEKVDMGGVEETLLKTTTNSMFKASKDTKLSKIIVSKMLVDYMDVDKIGNQTDLLLTSKAMEWTEVGENAYISIKEIHETDERFEVVFDTKGIQMDSYWFGGGIAWHNMKVNKIQAVRPDMTQDGYYKINIYKNGLNYADEKKEYDLRVEDIKLLFGDPNKIYKQIEEIEINSLNFLN